MDCDVKIELDWKDYSGFILLGVSVLISVIPLVRRKLTKTRIIFCWILGVCFASGSIIIIGISRLDDLKLQKACIDLAKNQYKSTVAHVDSAHQSVYDNLKLTRGVLDTAKGISKDLTNVQKDVNAAQDKIAENLNTSNKLVARQRALDQLASEAEAQAVEKTFRDIVFLFDQMSVNEEKLTTPKGKPNYEFTKSYNLLESHLLSLIGNHHFEDNIYIRPHWQNYLKWLTARYKGLRHEMLVPDSEYSGLMFDLKDFINKVYIYHHVTGSFRYPPTANFVNHPEMKKLKETGASASFNFSDSMIHRILKPSPPPNWKDPQ